MEHSCEPCKRDCERQEATGFCLDCDEYLCSGCRRAHRKMKALQCHVIVDIPVTRERGVEENTAFSPAPAHTDEVFSKQCLEHIGKTFEYFCTRCNVIACSECVSHGHKDCNAVYIPNISCNFDITRSDDMKTVTDTIEAIGSGLEEIEPRVNSQITDVKKIREDFAEGLEELKKDAMASIETAFKGIDKLFETITEEDVQHCRAIINNSKEAVAQLSNQANTETMDRLVSCLPKAVTVTNALLNTLPETPKAGKPRSHRHSLESLANIQNLIEAIYEVLSETKEIAIPESQLTNMSTETEDDTEQCLISAALVTGTRLVIADRGNKKVKVFDTVNKELIAELKLSGLFEDIGAVVNS